MAYTTKTGIVHEITFLLLKQPPVTFNSLPQFKNIRVMSPAIKRASDLTTFPQYYFRFRPDRPWMLAIIPYRVADDIKQYMGEQCLRLFTLMTPFKVPGDAWQRIGTRLEQYYSGLATGVRDSLTDLTDPFAVGKPAHPIAAVLDIMGLPEYKQADLINLLNQEFFPRETSTGENSFLVEAASPAHYHVLSEYSWTWDTDLMRDEDHYYRARHWQKHMEIRKPAILSMPVYGTPEINGYLGYCIINASGSLHITSLGVRPEARRTKIATRLIYRMFSNEPSCSMAMTIVPEDCCEMMCLLKKLHASCKVVPPDERPPDTRMQKVVYFFLEREDLFQLSK